MMGCWGLLVDVSSLRSFFLNFSLDSKGNFTFFIRFGGHHQSFPRSLPPILREQMFTESKIRVFCAIRVNYVSERERVLFIGTPFSNLYTLVHAPAIGRVVVCLVFVIACKYALGHSEFSQSLNLLLIMPPPTLWRSHFASCLPSLQQTPLQLAQAPPPLHLRPPHRVGPSPPPIHLA